VELTSGYWSGQRRLWRRTTATRPIAWNGRFQAARLAAQVPAVDPKRSYGSRNSPPQSSRWTKGAMRWRGSTNPAGRAKGYHYGVDTDHLRVGLSL